MYEEITDRFMEGVSPAQIFLDLVWTVTFTQAYQHRQVRRIGPDPIGFRFVCVEESGAHYCSQEAVEPDRAMDLYDLVPKNHAERLATLLRQSSGADGWISEPAQRSLDLVLSQRGVPADQRVALMAHKTLSAQEYLFRALELALDLAYPRVQGEIVGGVEHEKQRA